MEDNKLFGTDDIDIIASGRSDSKERKEESADSFDVRDIDRELEENGSLAAQNSAPRPARRPTAARRVPSHPSAARKPSAPQRPSEAPTQTVPSVEQTDEDATGNERTRVMTAAEQDVIISERRPSAPARKAKSAAPAKAGTEKPARAARPAKPPVKASEEKPGRSGREHSEEDQVKVKDKGGIFSTFSKTIVYIVAVIGVSILLSVVGIKFANDCFAFVKDDYETTVVINTGASISEVADVLKSSNVISQPLAFRLYAGFKYRNSNLEFAEGIYTLNSNMNYDQIIYTIKAGKAPARKTVKLTFPEGMTVDEIIDVLVENNIGTREGYVDAINNYAYDYPFMTELSKIELSSDRKYRLEGYLYPDTYEFYTDSTEVAVVDKFLNNFSSLFGEAEFSRCKELGYNMDEVMTIASIVQKESKFASEFYTTASVFYNRLGSKSFPKLESDATVQYCLAEHAEHITAELRNTDSKYNTYLYNGLPPSAICNPGIDAITAALYPEETGYYFFYAGSDGYNIFSKTLSEHQSVIAREQNKTK
ncbi:MAG: endolytic transglycosylase MltG [Firmicutes bacterium]|nr:endolytic transglycosylase MltG [Bacillota bacterium]